MKKIAISLFLAFFVVLCVNAQQNSTEILGTWKLVSHRYGDQKIQIEPESIQKIKLITQTHFIWIHFMATDNVVRNSAGGTYILNDGNYVENIEFGGSDMTPYFNKKQAFKIKIENGKMYLFGNLSDKLKIEEIWEKI